MLAGRSGACLSLRMDVYSTVIVLFSVAIWRYGRLANDVMLSSQAIEINTYFKRYASLNLVNVTRCFDLTRECCESCEGYVGL